MLWRRSSFKNSYYADPVAERRGGQLVHVFEGASVAGRIVYRSWGHSTILGLVCTRNATARRVAEFYRGLRNATLEYTFPLLPPNEKVGNCIRELYRQGTRVPRNDVC